jgi:hypothetical protein
MVGKALGCLVGPWQIDLVAPKHQVSRGLDFLDVSCKLEGLCLLSF